MPNHCANRLIASGTFEARSVFVNCMRGNRPRWRGSDKITEETLCFNNIVAVPEGVLRSGNLNWCVKNWGTKWGAYDVELKHDENKTVYTFLTAWSPPSNEFMEKIAEEFPEVTLLLQYAERLMEFYGMWYSEGGHICRMITPTARENLFWKDYEDLYEMSG